MIAALVILVILSAFFSATETAFTSLNRIRLKSRADSGNKRAALTLRIAEDYDKLLSTNLIGNNIVNISASTVGTVLFTKLFLDYGPLVSTVVLTVVILVFGEISPKSMAKENAEAFAMFAAPIMRVLMTVLAPVNYLFAPVEEAPQPHLPQVGGGGHHRGGAHHHGGSGRERGRPGPA